jgi:hypothetical protein
MTVKVFDLVAFDPPKVLVRRFSGRDGSIRVSVAAADLRARAVPFSILSACRTFHEPTWIIFES